MKLERQTMAMPSHPRRAAGAFGALHFGIRNARHEGNGTGGSPMFLASNARQSLDLRQTGANTVYRRFDMKHGHTNGRRVTPEYRAWQSMQRRCYTPSASHFAEYGGRGITVCEAWRASFPAFLADVGPRPSPTHSIDRIDVNGNYEPGNVRWATREEQHRNQRSNRMLTIDGVTMCATDWAKQSPVSFVAITRRLDAGWPDREAVFATSQNHGARALRRPPNFKPWTCVACAATVEGRKRANTGRCPACKLPRRREVAA